jgi:hypothetical protein
MSKYAQLGEYLKKQGSEYVPMTFAQIEKITGTKLPASARYRAWWSNNDFNSVLTKVWLDAGFKSEQVDMAARKLVFHRVRAARMSSESPRHHPALGAMKGLIRIVPGTDLTQPADPEWGASLDGGAK